MPAQPAKNYPLAVVSSTEAEADSEVARPDSSAVCAFCYGTGMEVVPGKGARRCHCRSLERQAKLLAEARIPRRHENFSLANYHPEPGNGTQLRAFNYAFKLVDEYPAIDRGLLLTGPCGVGKTHLAVAALRGLIEKGAQGLFYETGELLKAVQDSYGPASQTSENQVLNPVYEAEVLVLDELGAVKPTEWVRDTMMQVVGRRYNDGKLTVFTTNYADVRHSPADETLEDRVGVRLRSRLFEMCQTISVEGEDYRRRLGS